jgi:hypothetical protein
MEAAEKSLGDRMTEDCAERARKAFATHVITARSGERWLIQRIHEDGRPESTFWVEVAVLRGHLYVGGDIDTVVFKGGPMDPVARVRWMGESKSLTDYVAEKACSGLGSRELVWSWDREVAADDLSRHIADMDEESRVGVDSFYLQEAVAAETRDDFATRAADAIDDPDAWEYVGSFGELLDSRIIYAHAALARLCALLSESEAA